MATSETQNAAHAKESSPRDRPSESGIPETSPVIRDDNRELEQIEIQLLLEGIRQHCGFDLRNYAMPSLRRRIRKCLQAEKLATICGLLEAVLHDPACLERLLLSLSVSVTSLFRDPGLFLALRRHADLLRTYPFIRVWCAGCSTGEEAYSTAILLEEEGLYDRARIYATDANKAVVRKAQEGVFRLADMREYTANYQHAGGTRTFSDYYAAAYDRALMRPSLKRNIVFAQHNLASDASFNAFHLILCRNVMIYFNKELQARVHALIHDNLVMFGLLGLGSKESLRLTPHEGDYKAVDERERLYQRVH